MASIGYQRISSLPSLKRSLAFSLLTTCLFYLVEVYEGRTLSLLHYSGFFLLCTAISCLLRALFIRIRAS